MTLPGEDRRLLCHVDPHLDAAGGWRDGDSCSLRPDCQVRLDDSSPTVVTCFGAILVNSHKPYHPKKLYHTIAHFCRSFPCISLYSLIAMICFLQVSLIFLDAFPHTSHPLPLYIRRSWTRNEQTCLTPTRTMSADRGLCHIFLGLPPAAVPSTSRTCPYLVSVFSVLRCCFRCCWVHLMPSYGPPFRLCRSYIPLVHATSVCTFSSHLQLSPHLL